MVSSVFLILWSAFRPFLAPAVAPAMIPAIRFAPNVWVWWQFKECETMDDVRDVVEANLRAGRTRWMLRGIPCHLATKADGVFYVSLSVAYPVGSRKADVLLPAIAEELLRRPLLSDKLADAAVAVSDPGPFPEHDGSAIAEWMVNRATRDRFPNWSKEELAAFSKKIPPDDDEILEFFVAWALTGRPVSVNEIGRHNFYSYQAELSRWCNDRRDRIVFDENSRRLVVKPRQPGQRASTDEERSKMTIKIPHRGVPEFHGVSLGKKKK